VVAIAKRTLARIGIPERAGDVKGSPPDAVSFVLARVGMASSLEGAPERSRGQGWP
jgi:hypothetical protein